jgi:hypothetical protein
MLRNFSPPVRETPNCPPNKKSSRIFRRPFHWKKGRFAHTQPGCRRSRRIGGIFCINRVITLNTDKIFKLKFLKFLKYIGWCTILSLPNGRYHFQTDLIWPFGCETAPFQYGAGSWSSFSLQSRSWPWSSLSLKCGSGSCSSIKVMGICDHRSTASKASEFWL